MTSVLKTNAAFTAHEKPTTGDIKMSFVNYDHLGWLKCDGRALTIDEFSLLFQVIGYTFTPVPGGDIFNLPNTFGKVLGSVSPAYPPGTDTGSYTHTLTIAELPPHNHGTQTATAQPVGNFELTSNSFTGITQTNTDGAHTHSGTANDSADSQHQHSGTTAGAGAHTHTSNANGGNGELGQPPVYGLATADGTLTAINTDSSDNEIKLWTNPVALVINGVPNHTHNYTTPADQGTHTHTVSIPSSGTHQHLITDQQHNHTLLSIGGGQPHDNMQPTLFIGNTFIYSGIPTYPGFPPNPASAWPFTVGLNPPMI